ncbi:MAG: hypothetical protein JKY89_10870 [Immundisolibacteraceae bacterium]|nr:hypothetical protein [Immundisolibacteraceae bacterium]
MDASDVVYNGIYKGAKAKGAADISAVKYANMGARMYRQSSFSGGSVSKLIDSMILEASKESKKSKKRMAPMPAVIVADKVKPKPRSKPSKPKAFASKPSSIASQTVRDRKFASDDGLWSKPI